jgi:hypothetical protein
MGDDRSFFNGLALSVAGASLLEHHLIAAVV